ncbi:uncharacterized protein CC84DRAFT_1176886 [Paraphaeosphaeria sporulosa]|uniref:Uncharacterized protein n=1 Tax=Paraphaeosphaeria sporulosa TaxID=1460663 RepID=A0A177CD41_9PLEO|nr:uncharacterized protein CC84DRAFT_1176886 [Paraphaeosphaeria sporulosa]OAG04707.1 hypothetical protein CC84DRAFT_1176886 [Paraphaeosphaeria sporulosa]
MPQAKLNPLSKDKPFLLMRLPLTELSIGLTGSSSEYLKKDVAIYHNLMSSLLCSQNTTRGSPSLKVHTQTEEKIERLVALSRWLYKPDAADVYRTLRALETRKAVVRATNDLLWKTVVFFVTSTEWGFATPHVDGDRYLHFLEEMLRGSAALEFAQVKHRSGGL